MQNKNANYDYVSYSSLKFRYDVNKLIESASSWEMMENENIGNFDFISFKKSHEDNNPVPEDIFLPQKKLTVPEQLLSLISHDHFRSGEISYIKNDEVLFIDIIKKSVDKGIPVDIILPSFPGREVNPIARTRPQIHLGEIAAICRLAQLCTVSKEIYSPGIRFIIITDGVAYAPFYGDPTEGARNYQECFKETIVKLGCDDLILVEDLAEIINERKEEFDKVYDGVKKEISAVWNDSSYHFRDELEYTMRMGTQSGALNAAAVHLVKFMGGNDEDDLRLLKNMREAIKNKALRTAYIYQCLLVTLRRMEMLPRRFPHAIRGTVHAKQGQYAPHLVNKETTVSPWHGMPVLRKNGRVDVVYEAEIYCNPEKYVAVFIDKEVLPFYFRQK